MKRSIAITLILFLLLGQTGFTFATHYCGGHEVKTSLVVGNILPDCGMNMMQACEMNTSDYDGPLVKSEPCCKNHIRTVEASKDLLGNILNTNFAFSDDFPVFLELALINVDTEEILPHYANNSPPGIEPDRQILFQTFLI